MIIFPDCKINLGLHILYKREDNYHEVETVMYPIPLQDILEIVPSDELIFTSTGLEIPGNPENNLCSKAYELLKKLHDIPPVHIHLHKIIPMGGGLGGGSSNGAFTLILLNNLFELDLSLQELKIEAAKLGSDCAFFIENTPQLCTGRGEITAPIEFSLADFFIKIINLGIHVSTAEAYSGVIPKAPQRPILEVLSQDITEWKGLLINDFEPGIFNNHPELAVAKNKLLEEGALYASMTGSGSTLYGIYARRPEKSFLDIPVEVVFPLR